MKTLNHIETNYSDAEVQYHEAAVSDFRGRAVSFRVVRGTAKVTVPAAPRWYGTSMEPGDYFFARIQQLRNGKSFGAVQGVEYFRTEQERDAWVQKTLKSRIARVRKQFALA